jgi:hypothetical protein
MGKKIIYLILLAAMAGNAWAGGIQSGLWELTLTISVTESPNIAMQPILTPPPLSNTISRCLNEQEAEDPYTVMTSMMKPAGATNCNYTEKEYSGNTLHFSVQCDSGPGIIRAIGEISYSSTTMNGRMATSYTRMQGPPSVAHYSLNARRTDECPR